MDFTKRRLLKFTSYGLCLNALGLPAGLAAGAGPHAGGHRSELTPLLESMQAVGKAYLDKHPDERSRSRLLSLLESRIDVQNGGLPALTWNDLDTMIKEDFEHDNIVFLHGWALALAEARLCALSVA